MGFFFFFCIYQGVELLHHFGNSVFNILMNCHTIYYSSYTIFTFSPTVHKGSISPYPCQHLLFSAFVLFFIVVILMSARWYLFVVLTCVSIMFSDIEHFFFVVYWPFLSKFLLHMWLLFMVEKDISHPLLNPHSAQSEPVANRCPFVYWMKC